MTKKSLKKTLSCVLVMALIAAMTVLGTACTKQGNVTASEVISASENVASEVVSEVPADSEKEEYQQLGEGEIDFTLTVVYADGSEDYFAVKTDAEDLGTALLDVDLVEGDMGDYGLYIKAVNGVTADYDVDGSWGGFYIGDEMAQVGVSDTKVEEGAEYTLKYEK
jgi:hypothetical protein